MIPGLHLASAPEAGGQQTEPLPRSRRSIGTETGAHSDRRFGYPVRLSGSVIRFGYLVSIKPRSCQIFQILAINSLYF